MTERVRDAVPAATPTALGNGNRPSDQIAASEAKTRRAAGNAPDRPASSIGDAAAASRQVPLAGGSQRPPWRITVEGACYAALLVLALLTRFWDLGSRTLHHDETLHTYYSWLFATGQGYVHDPLMHGPFLFHANAFIYWLFGDSDATSRIMPALFGVTLVGLPYFLRGPRHLGRWGALIASTLFLLSPALLYQSRYIRHDIYTVVGSLALFIGIVRYIERPQRRWLICIGATLGFLLTNHEIVFGVAAIFGGVLWAALLWGPLRSLVPLHLFFIALAGVLYVVKPGPLARSLPVIPWDRTGSQAPVPSRENQLRFYWDLFTHPLAIAIAALALVTTLGMAIVLARRSEGADRHGILLGAAALGLMPILLWGAAVFLFDAEQQTAIGSLAISERLGIGRYLIAAALLIGGIILG
ncbi:MAG: TIGR03663 family protein, partial [Chloroflexota bacterium]|nr:TIGR03663 family protein [Chloroflexota bacterium]